MLKKDFIKKFFVFVFVFIVHNNNLKSQIRINEIMASNANTYLETGFYNYPDWIELKNAGDSSVSMLGYYISDDRSVPQKWAFPDVTIDTGEYYLIYCDYEISTNYAYFKLNAGGEVIYLVNEDGQVVDSLRYPKQYSDISFGFSDKDSRWHYCIKPTPGTENETIKFLEQNPFPVFSVEAGRNSIIRDLEITTSDTNATIYYTKDCSLPTEVKSEYNDELFLSSTTVVRAAIFGDDKLPGMYAANTYFINEHEFTLPVISISVDPKYLYDSYQGILTSGVNGIKKYCSSGPLNWNQDWERAAYVEYFDESGKRVIAQQVGIKIAGGCSRQRTQKSFSLYARGKYGNEEFNYPFFKEKPHNSHYRSLLLRNSGNDFNQTMLRDAFMQRLIVGAADIDHQAHQPVIVYLNGKYYGLMNLREKTDEDFFYTNYGIEDDILDFHIAVEFQIGTIRGSDSCYQNLLSYLSSNDLTTQENYDSVVNQVDIDEFMNYFIFQTYYANTDWPGHNNKFWKPYGGKWRWMLYDTDFGFGGSRSYDFSSLYYVTQGNSTNRFNPPWVTLLFRKLIKNEDFKNQFIQTYLAHIGSTFHPERCNFMLDSLADIIEEEMGYHQKKYGGSISSWKSKIEEIKAWGEARYNFMPGYIASFFNLNSEQYAINISAPVLGKGGAMVNNVNLTYYPSSMATFKGLPYTITAKPESGYKFSHWETSSVVSESELISLGEKWKYLDEASAYPTDWTMLTFNDALWSEGAAQLGYGDGDEATVISYGGDTDNKIPTALFRKKLTVSDTSGITLINAKILADDGAIVYLNGTEIFRTNITAGTINFNDYSGLGAATENVYVPFSIDKSLIVQGENVFAVEVHQHSATSSDLSFDFSLDFVKSNNITPQFYSSAQTLSGTVSESLNIRPVFEEAEPVEGITVNELASPSRFLLGEYGEEVGFIELYNSTEDSIDVGGMFLTNDYLNPAKHRISDDNPELTTIPPKGFLMFYADGYDERGALHTNFSLNKLGGAVALVQKIGETVNFIDTVSFKILEKNYSFGRYGDGQDKFCYMAKLTPGDKNVYTGNTTTTVSETISALEFKVYPNPATDIMYVEIPRTEFVNMSFSVLISDISGRLAMSYNNVSEGINQVNISSLKQGIYFVQINANNRTFQTRKLIKR